MYLNKADEEKKKIVAAARSLFLTEGYTHVSMRKIAAKVGYSPTNIYNYFTNKEEIVLQLLEEGYAQFLTYLEEAVEQNKEADIMVRLKAALYAYVQFSLDHPDYYNLIFIHNLESEDTVIVPESDRMKGFWLLFELTKEAIEKEVLPDQDSLMVSESLWALVHGISSLFIKFRTFKWVNKEELITHHIDTYVNGLYRDQEFE